MEIGVTGTKRGMTSNQMMSFHKIISEFSVIDKFHHGDCIGVDAQAHHFLDGNTYIVVHPPTNPKYRAFCVPKNGIILPENDYIIRDHQMVDQINILIGMPKEDTMILRSGTWATIRYADKNVRPLYIIFPNGNIERRNI